VLAVALVAVNCIEAVKYRTFNVAFRDFFIAKCLAIRLSYQNWQQRRFEGSLPLLTLDDTPFALFSNFIVKRRAMHTILAPLSVAAEARTQARREAAKKQAASKKAAQASSRRPYNLHGSGSSRYGSKGYSRSASKGKRAVAEGGGGVFYNGRLIHPFIIRFVFASFFFFALSLKLISDERQPLAICMDLLAILCTIHLLKVLHLVHCVVQCSFCACFSS
jgi:hypothetical protein